MTVLSPRYYGFEGVLYWNTTANPFIVDPVTETVSAANISAWISAAFTSDDILTVNYAMERERKDVTSRPRALQGWNKEHMLVNRAAVSFTLHHVRTANALVKELLDAINTLAEIPLGVIDSPVSPRQGLLGNFEVQMTKGEPLRGIQTWDVVAVPNSWVEYWRE